MDTSAGQRLRTINQNIFLQNNQILCDSRELFEVSPDQDNHKHIFWPKRWPSMFRVGVTKCLKQRVKNTPIIPVQAPLPARNGNFVENLSQSYRSRNIILICDPVVSVHTIEPKLPQNTFFWIHIRQNHTHAH